MVKRGLFSHHIVLTDHSSKDSRYPLSGIILISDDLIEDVVILEPTTSFSSILSTYSSWSPTDYSDFYLFPGIIDLNVRMEWDSYESLTWQAVKGGVTLMFVEQGYYQSAQIPNSLHCDVGQIHRVDDTTDLSSLPPSVCALKGYLFPPSQEIRTIVNLPHTIQRTQACGLPMLIDPTIPDLRMLYMASPSRLESLEDRAKNDVSNSGNTIFPAAFPEARGDGSSQSEESEESEEIDLSKMKTHSLQANEVKPIFHKRVISNEKIHDVVPAVEIVITEEKDEYESSPYVLNKEFVAKRRASYDIYNDLDNRIKQSTQNIEDLVKAEKYTYSLSGSTKFLSIDTPKKASSLSELNIASMNLESITNPPEPSIVHSISDTAGISKRPVRPKPIQIKTTVKPDVSQDYNYFLANYPEHWETSGVEKVLECVKPDYRLHFTNISSAAAVNMVRQSRKKNANLTCEIPAAHLCFTSNSVTVGDTRFKSTPPIRNEGNCNLLWDLLKMKGIDCISSQHAAIHPDKKVLGNFQQALNGISGIGCSLQAVWYMLNIPVSTTQQLEHYIVRLAKWLCVYPAKIMNMEHVRGSIAKGKMADIVVWEPYARYSLGGAFKYAKTSPFMQQELMGKIHRVYVRGNIAFDAESAESRYVGTQVTR